MVLIRYRVSSFRRLELTSHFLNITSQHLVPNINMSSTSADSTAQTSELNIAYQISSRIKQHVPLKIDESGVKKRGQGVFVLEGVKAAEPIFSVEPLLTMVGSAHRGCHWCQVADLRN